MCNAFTNAYFVMEILGSGPDLSANVMVVSNCASGGNQFAYGYGWSTNVSFVGNAISGYSGGLNGSTLGGQWFLDDASNVFPTNAVNDTVGGTNVISYVYGMRWKISSTKTNSVWIMDDTHPAQVPPGAIMQTSCSGGYPATLYLSASMAGTPVLLPPGASLACRWTNGAWRAFINPVWSPDLHVVNP